MLDYFTGVASALGHRTKLARRMSIFDACRNDDIVGQWPEWPPLRSRLEAERDILRAELERIARSTYDQQARDGAHRALERTKALRGPVKRASDI